MISTFRNFFSSKLGLGLTLGFLALIAFAFASSDVANQATFGGVSGGDRVAVVGEEKIGNADFRRQVGNAVEQIRQQDPTITLPAFAAQGGFEEVLEQMIDRVAIGTYAREYGLRAGENLVNSEILEIPAFRGPDGGFSQDSLQQFLRRQNMNEAMLRGDLGDSLLAQQMVLPGLSGAQMPRKFAMRYASLLGESREGSVAFIPSASFAPEGDPTDEQLTAFYDENRDDYIRPERRVLRYATFGVENLDADVTPTQDEIAARYERDRAQYTQSEDRTLTQLIVPTQDAANSIRDQVNGGASFASVARNAGFSTTQLGPINSSDYGSQTSEAVATAVFAAPQGQIAEPARSSLGWHVVRVDNVTRIAGRPLADVAPDIASELLAEKQAIALSDLSARVEEQVDGGVALSQVTQELGVEISSTAPVTADGQVYGVPGAQLPQLLVGAVSTAFQMDEGEPQLAEIVRGTTFMVFEVSEITQSAAAPLDEIRDQIEVSWRLSEGATQAKEAADRVIGRVDGENGLAAAMREEETQLPPVDELNINRQQLLAQGQQIPPALALMFSMAEGTTKRLEAPNDLGWFIVDLKNIETPEIAANDPIIEASLQQLRGAVGDELAQQLTNAMRAELGVETNETALEAVKRLMTNQN